MLFVLPGNVAQALELLKTLNSVFLPVTPTADSYPVLSSDKVTLKPMKAMPGIFYLHDNDASKGIRAIAKAGLDRALNDLLTASLAYILGMPKFFPLSFVAALPVKDLLSKPKKPKRVQKVKAKSSGAASAAHAEGIHDDEGLWITTPDGKHEFYTKLADLKAAETLTLLSVQKFVPDVARPQQPLKLAKITIFAYLVFMKDLKSNGIINTDCGPVVVDGAANIFMDRAVLSNDVADEQQIPSVGLHIMDEWQDLILSKEDISSLQKHFNAVLADNFTDKLTVLLSNAEKGLASLMAILQPATGCKIRPIEFHKGHEQVGSLLALRPIIESRLEQVIASLVKIYGNIDDKGCTLFNLVGELDKQYKEAYLQVALTKSGVLDDKVARLYDQECQRTTPANLVGACTFPHAISYSQHLTQGQAASKLLLASQELKANFTKLCSLDKTADGKKLPADYTKQLKLVKEKISNIEAGNRLLLNASPSAEDISFPSTEEHIDLAENILASLQAVVNVDALSERELEELKAINFSTIIEISKGLAEKIKAKKLLMGARGASASPIFGAPLRSLSFGSLRSASFGSLTASPLPEGDVPDYSLKVIEQVEKLRQALSSGDVGVREVADDDDIVDSSRGRLSPPVIFSGARQSHRDAIDVVLIEAIEKDADEAVRAARAFLNPTA